jgi:hypothetical protein
MGERAHVWNFVSFGVFSAHGSDAGIGGFASFGKSIVAGVKVFSFLGMLLDWLLSCT